MSIRVDTSALTPEETADLFRRAAAGVPEPELLAEVRRLTRVHLLEALAALDAGLYPPSVPPLIGAVHA